MIEAKLTYVSADAVPEQAAAKEGEPEPPKRYSFIVRAHRPERPAQQGHEFRAEPWHAGRPLYQDRRTHVFRLPDAPADGRLLAGLP